MKTILIAGGSGLVGQRLTSVLLEKGYKVRWLSRSSRDGEVPSYKWDTAAMTIDEAAFKGVDVIINLAGAGIADARWTETRKKILIESRTLTAKLLKSYITKLNLSLDLYINASAVGYYGNQGSDWMNENDGPGDGFLSKCCVAWENAAEDIQGDFPTTIIRIGIVLSTQGGALDKMLLPLKVKTNTYFGDGRQYMSWIHIDDLCGIFIHLIENPTNGIFNAVASNPMQNKAFAKEVARGMDTFALLMPTPKMALRLAMGEMADVVLESTRVDNHKIKELGYQFQWEDVSEAVSDLNARNI